MERSLEVSQSNLSSSNQLSYQQHQFLHVSVPSCQPHLQDTELITRWEQKLKILCEIPCSDLYVKVSPVLFSLWCSTSRRRLCLGLHMDLMLNPCCSLTVKRCQLALHLLGMARNQRPVTSASQLCLWIHACVREHVRISMHDRWR